MGAAQPWARFYNPHVYARSSTGAPVPGAKAYFYVSGSAQKLTTFRDSALSVPNDNPVDADANGKFPDIFLQNLNYRVIITDPNGVQIDYADPVSPFIQAAQTLNNFVSLDVTWDGNGTPIPAGKQGDVYCPINCQIIAAVAMSKEAGTLACDVWAAEFVANTPPNLSNSITAGAPIELNSSVSSIDTSLPSWATFIGQGFQVRFNLETNDVITRVSIQLICQPV